MLKIPNEAVERRVRMAAAASELTEAIGKIAETHQLSFTELYLVLAQEIVAYARIEVRETENAEAEEAERQVK